MEGGVCVNACGEEEVRFQMYVRGGGRKGREGGEEGGSVREREKRKKYNRQTSDTS